MNEESAAVALPEPKNKPDWNKTRILRSMDNDDRRYLLNENIFSSGGMAYAHEVYDMTLDKILIAKQTKFSTDREKLDREAKTLAALAEQTHGVPTVYDTFEDMRMKGWIIMEKIEGKGLERYIVEPDYDAAKALHIAKKITHTLAVATDLGIQHRDVKPDNIVVDNNGDPKLIDFGVSNKALPGVTTHVGSLDYMAPEVRDGQDTSTKSDIYSFGCTLRLFSATAEEGSVKDALEKIGEKASSYAPEKRYSTFDEILDELNKIDGSPKKQKWSKSAIQRAKEVLRIKK